MVRPVMVWLPVLVVTACTLKTLPDLTSGPGPSGGAGVVEAGSADDASRTDDAAVALPFCARAKHAFCDDFDRDGGPAGGWSHPTVTTASHLDLSTARFASALTSLHATTPSLASGAPTEYASLVREFPGDWRHIMVEFDVELMTPSWFTGSSSAGLVCIGLYSGSDGGDGSCVSIASDGISLGSPGGAPIPAQPLPYDTWFHVKVDFEPKAGRISGTLADHPISGTFSPMTAGAAPKIVVQLGLQAYNKPLPPLAAYYDNLIVDFP